MKLFGIISAAILMSFVACKDNSTFTKRALLLLGMGGTSSLTGNGHDWTLMSGIDSTAPSSTVRLVFIHHSTGSAWIATGYGNLGATLNANNYYVTECDYGWDAQTNDNLGDTTDTVYWPLWFNDTKMPYVYSNTSHFDYPANTLSDPGGENEIIMFKSCYPNSEVGGSITDEQTIYNGLLAYFAAHTNKMFVLIVPPPEIDIASAPLTRELANWLVADDGWLDGYTGNNVYVFDYYNVLTDPDNHHRVESGEVKHIITDYPSRPSHANELYYPTGDSHPSAAGQQKATAEFVPLLNAFYNNWKP